MCVRIMNIFLKKGGSHLNSVGRIGVTVDVPRSFGLFHILCLVALFLIAILLARALDGASERKFRYAMLIIWITLALFDLYKQITHDYMHTDGAGNIIYDYYWYAFPFQLCSTPLYVLPLIAFLKEGRLREAFISFLTFFSLIGGVFVLILPETCFTDRLFVNIQTMLHHGAQVIISILLVRRYKSKMRFRFFLDGFFVFLAFVGIAFLLNVSINGIFGEAVYGFNMFYIGPYYLELMPALSFLSEIAPYPVFLFGYIVLISSLAYLSYRILLAIVTRGAEGEGDSENFSNDSNENIEK